MALTVAVTGPTGEIGIAAVDALEREPEVERIIGMARRPFDPTSYGWVKTEYRQGDILDRAAVESLVEDADVVVHLAYLIMGSRAASHLVNLDGTRNVFEATVDAERPQRLVYTSSVAAYGYHPDNPQPLTEDVPTRGSKEHYYSQQKAECETLLRETTTGTGLEVYVLRPCIVAGPRATALADSMPWRQLAARLDRLAVQLPRDRCAFLRRVGHGVRVDRDRDVELARGKQLTHHRVALGDLGVGGQLREEVVDLLIGHPL